MPDPPIFRHGFALVRDQQGTERVVWPSSDVELAGAMAARERVVDEQGAIDRVRTMLRQRSKAQSAPVVTKVWWS
jgi:hypothetical protein